MRLQPELERAHAGAVARARAPLAGEITIDAIAMPAVVVSEHGSGERDLQIGGALTTGVAAKGEKLRI